MWKFVEHDLPILSIFTSTALRRWTWSLSAVEIDTTGTGFKREACDPPQSVVLACPKNPLRRHEGWRMLMLRTIKDMVLNSLHA
ncbi:hypothetical protein C4D60_Mb02t10860 [Musa balbisiana]|uniref:Uncharacterized protein n=1 Tax=Musa balbisiana TaxID=52838 RepID=A0A4S8I9Z8_MUSBA|nr:hypothetical protein C4D60_Mb02t10860 [Musa balbisiana]